jgi:membrane protein implicated in regulation of membrane protease activity
MNAGTAIAILLGPLLYQWLANHERFTLQLVKLVAAIVFGLFLAIGFHLASMIALGHEPSWDADEQVVIFSAVAFVALWEWRAARKPAVRHYDADEIEIIPSEKSS